MAQTRHGALRSSAKRLGITVADYARHILLGEKRCGRCKNWKDRSMFDRDISRGDARASVCRSCRESPARSGPSKRERRRQRLQGKAWCSSCEAWRQDVRRGKCREHRNAAHRQRYAESPEFRFKRQNKTALRRRGVEAVPPGACETLLDVWGGLCAYCPSKAETWDHIIPVSKGGKTVPWNIVPACKSCNSRKRDRDIDDWLAEIDGERAVKISETMILEELPTQFHAGQLHSEGLDAGS